MNFRRYGVIESSSADWLSCQVGHLLQHQQFRVDIAGVISLFRSWMTYSGSRVYHLIHRLWLC